MRISIFLRVDVCVFLRNWILYFMRVQQFEVSLENIRVERETVHSEKSISIVRNVNLHVPTGCCFTMMDNKLKLLKESTVWYPVVAQERFGLIPRKIREDFSEIVFPLGEQQNYFHWLLEDLPQLLVARQQEIEFTILTSDGLSKFQENYLEVLNIDRLILESDWIRSSRILLVPKQSSNSPRFDERIQTIRAAFSEYFMDRETEILKIYISRSRSRRSLPQESELEEFLKENGFRVVHLEELDILEQVKLFNQASLIIAPHGAGLANLVFCQKDTHVVEIMNPILFNDCYMRISSALGLHHTLIEYGHYDSFVDFQEHLRNVIS